MTESNRDKNQIKELIDKLNPFTYDKNSNIKRHAVGLKKNLEQILTEEENGDIKIIDGAKYKRID